MLTKYGPTLTLDELAEVLKRRPGGVRSALSTRSEPWAIELSQHKVYVGRRVHFPADVVADLLAGELTSVDRQ
ncbi:hypothetical protein [Paracidovorax wautersii]|uniref:hypothetical protein n=1 Tax=Paracidovorax wautersii TaxID=1177982 RepID=UPI001FE49F35|nr:hypothetical protein [Paracidovorax wautersii]